MDAIKIEHANKKIGKATILDDINLVLPSKQIYAFVGENGSGKTMLFRAIAGLIRLNKGSIEVFGKIIGKDISFPDGLGITIENTGFWPDLTGVENLKLLASIRKIVKEKDINQTLDRVGLDPRDKRTYKKYSYGMKQKLAIAQAIMESPCLIMLDEPTNGLDFKSIKLIHELLLEEQRRGATILMATHSQYEVESLANEIFQMHMGSCSPYKGMEVLK